MQEINFGNITIDKLTIPVLSEKKINLSVLRLDKIHPLISGNKWFKLQYYIQDAIRQNKNTLVTFGGAWSNHILATASACRIKQLNSIGVIRGEEAKNLSPTLRQSKDLGMKLVFVSREDYQIKNIPEELKETKCYHIAEGGYGQKGAEGAATILNHFDHNGYSHICCAAGTGTMAAGLLSSISNDQILIAISVLKNYVELEEKVKDICKQTTNELIVNHDYHFGGYAKHKAGLIQFMNEFYQHTTVPTDFVYTGKLCYAILDLIKKDYFPAGSNLLLIHSGGLQGNSSLDNGTLIF